MDIKKTENINDEVQAIIGGVVIPEIYSKLDVVRDVEVDTEEVQNLACSIDCGAGTTRVSLISNVTNIGKLFGDLKDVVVIPSELNIIQLGDKTVYTDTEQLYGNLDSTISVVDGNHELLPVPERILRGQLREKTNRNPEMMKAGGTKKMDSKLLYLNIVDSLHYSIVSKYGSEALAGTYNIYLNIALPPEEIISSDDEAILKERLLHDFQVVNNQLGYSININIADVSFDTESAYYYVGHMILEEGAKPLPETGISINIGSRSTGLDIMKGGKRQPASSKTFYLGGRNLTSKLKRELLQQKQNINNQSELTEILNKGYLLKGISTIVPLGREIEKIKREIAKDLAKEIILHLDETGENLSGVKYVMVSGGTARNTPYILNEDKHIETDEDGDDIYLSVADYLMEELEEELGDAEYIHSDGEYVASGAGFLAYKTYQGLIK